MKVDMKLALILLSGGLVLGACQNEDIETKKVEQIIDAPVFHNVSVHDPSVLGTDDGAYIIGSHLQFAKSDDLMKWESLSESVPTTNLFEDVYAELAEDFEFAQSDTIWSRTFTGWSNL